MKIIPLFENEFYHDGRGPELMNVVWIHNGIILMGFEFYNPGDEYKEENIKHLILEKIEVYSMAGDEVHGNILATGKSKAAIFKIENSKWHKQFNQGHLGDCSHYQIMFYDEIYDIICKNIIIGTGRIDKNKV